MSYSGRRSFTRRELKLVLVGLFGIGGGGIITNNIRVIDFVRLVRHTVGIFPLRSVCGRVANFFLGKYSVLRPNVMKNIVGTL